VIGLIIGRYAKQVSGAPGGAAPEVEVVQVEQKEYPSMANGSARLTASQMRTSGRRSRDIYSGRAIRKEPS